MLIGARPGTEADLADFARLYRGLEAEMAALRPIWALADGLRAPQEVALRDILRHGLATAGTIDEVIVGFLTWHIDPLLPQAGGERIGVIDLLFTEPEARGVGVGEAMLTHGLASLRAAGVKRFDVSVLPGHRQAKNFFEAAGFKARSIIMHHEDT